MVAEGGKVASVKWRAAAARTRVTATHFVDRAMALH